ncbi:MAG TPA: hypothetical protein VIN40_06930 [Candidatus Tyrphobacter sp.]
MPLIGILVVVLLALAVYLRSSRRPIAIESSGAIPLSPPDLMWTRRVVGDAPVPKAQERIAIVGRLALLGNAWSAGVLEDALADEYDATVRDAIWRALLALRREAATHASEST